MNLIRNIIVLVAVMLANMELIAQDNIVYGRVVNEADSTAISNAKCTLFAETILISSTQTDDNGQFYFKYNPKKSYQIVISAKGFEETELKFAGFKGSHNLGIVPMIKTTMLDEFTVSANTRLDRLGKLYVTPSKFQVNASNSSFDLLSKLNLPGFRIDIMSSNPTVDNGAVYLYVDGVPTDVTYLKTLKASDVQTVEFQDRQPLRYGGGRGGVINIILKQRDDGVQIFAGADFVPYLKDGQAAFNAEYHKGASSFDVLYDFGYHDLVDTDFSEITDYISKAFTIEESRIGVYHYKSLSNNVRLSYTYKPNSTTAFQATYRIGDFYQKRTETSDCNDVQFGDYTRDSRYRSDNFYPGRLNLFFRKDFDKHKFEFQLDGSYSRNDILNLIEYVSGAPMGTLFDNGGKSDNYGLNFDAFYNFNIDNTSSVEASYYGHFIFNRNSYNNDNSVEHQTNTSNFLRATYSKIIDRFDFQVAPAFIITSNRNSTGGGPVSNTYVSPTGRINLGLRLSRLFRLRGDFTVSTRTPQLIDYSSHIEQVNLFLYNTGNPDLKTQTQLYGGLSLNFNNGKYNASARVSYDHRINPKYESVTCMEEGKFLSQTVNYNKERSVYVDLNTGANGLWDMFGYNLSLGYQHTDAHAHTFNSVLNRFSFYGQVYFNWKHLTVQYQLSLADKTISGPVTTTTPFNNTLSVNYRINSHWDVSVSSMYFLQKGVKISETVNNQQDYKQTISMTVPNFRSYTRISFTYRTGFGTRKNTKIQRRLNGESGESSFRQ